MLEKFRIMKVKFFIYIAIYFLSINSYSEVLKFENKRRSPVERWLYALNLDESHKNNEINDIDYIQKSKKCFNEGIGYCAVNISQFYYLKEDYSKARA